MEHQKKCAVENKKKELKFTKKQFQYAADTLFEHLFQPTAKKYCFGYKYSSEKELLEAMKIAKAELTIRGVKPHPIGSYVILGKLDHPEDKQNGPRLLIIASVLPRLERIITPALGAPVFRL